MSPSAEKCAPSRVPALKCHLNQRPGPIEIRALNYPATQAMSLCRTMLALRYCPAFEYLSVLCMGGLWHWDIAWYSP